MGLRQDPVGEGPSAFADFVSMTRDTLPWEELLRQLDEDREIEEQRVRKERDAPDYGTVTMVRNGTRRVLEVYAEGEKSGKLTVEFTGDLEDGIPGVFEGILGFNTLVVSRSFIGVIKMMYGQDHIIIRGLQKAEVEVSPAARVDSRVASLREAVRAAEENLRDGDAEQQAGIGVRSPGSSKSGALDYVLYVPALICKLVYPRDSEDDDRWKTSVFAWPFFANHVMGFNTLQAVDPRFMRAYMKDPKQRVDVMESRFMHANRGRQFASLEEYQKARQEWIALHTDMYT
ncbi:g9157 [Coccomyxa elongata]